LKVIMLFGVTAHTATKAFFTKYNLAVPDSVLALLLFFHTGGMLASQYFWYRVSVRLDKRAAYTIGAVLFYCRLPRLRPTVFGYHEVWHAFTILAAVSHLGMVWSVAT